MFFVIETVLHLFHMETFLNRVRFCVESLGDDRNTLYKDILGDELIGSDFH